MSNNKKKKGPQKVVSHKTGAPIAPSQPPEVSAETKKERKNIAKHSTIIFVFTAVALLVIFAGRWVFAITNGYYDTFVNHGDAITSATTNMEGLTPSEGEAASMLELEKMWDLFTSSRLCDEITITAQDGIDLHGYLYDQGSDTTVIYIPRFAQDGTSDFLPGVWLSGQHGYNLLLLDQRTHGKSGGEVFSYGYFEQQDLADWLDWTENTLGSQHLLLWGEGTGANTALFAEASGLLDDRVELIVAESPYGSLHQLASRNIFHWFTVPAFPFLYTIEWKLSAGDAGYQISDTNLRQALEGADCATPVLFLSCSEDDYILPQWTEAVTEAYSGEKQAITGGSSHGTVYIDRQQDIQEVINSYMAS